MDEETTDPSGASQAAKAGGAALGGLGGAVSGYAGAKASKRAGKEAIRQQKAEQIRLGELQGIRTGETNATYDPMLQGFTQNQGDYYGALKNSSDLSKYNVGDLGNFAFDLNQATQDELNPELDAITNAANANIEQSHANAGKLLSGAAGRAIARSTADITANEWGSARGRAMQAQQNKYQQFMDKWNSGMKKNEFNANLQQQGTNNLGTLYNSQSGMFGAKQQQLQGIRQNTDNAVNQSRQQEIAGQVQKAGTPGKWESAFAGGLSGIGSALSGGK